MARNGRRWVPAGLADGFQHRGVWCVWAGPWEHVTLSFARGFVDAARGPWAAWAAHADALLERHPVRAVTLTTWPESATSPGGFVSLVGVLAGGASFDPARAAELSPAAAESNTPRAAGGRRLLPGLLGLRWPGVRIWHLPEPLAGPGPDDPDRVVRVDASAPLHLADRYELRADGPPPGPSDEDRP